MGRRVVEIAKDGNRQVLGANLSIGTRPDLSFQSTRAVWETIRPAWWLWIWLIGSLTKSPWTTATNALVAFGWMVLIHRLTEPKSNDPIRTRRRSAIEAVAGIAVSWGGLIVLLHTTVAQRFLAVVRPALHRAAEFSSDPSAWYGWFDNAAANAALLLIPVAALAFVFRTPPSELGLLRFPGRLVLALLVGTWVIGAIGDSPTEPVAHWPLWLVLGLLINAGPEELLYRAWLIPRLRGLRLRPFDAIGISAFLFGASHIPGRMARGESFFDTLDVVSLIYPSGIVWGYLWIRTQSLWACIVWHASILVVGNMFNPFG